MEETCNIDGEIIDCYCPLSGIIDTLSKKYTIQIICIIGAHETIRFNQIESHIKKASTSTLSNRLEELTKKDIINRIQHDEIPPKVEYTLTQKGKQLCKNLQPLLDWLTKNT